MTLRPEPEQEGMELEMSVRVLRELLYTGDEVPFLFGMNLTKNKLHESRQIEIGRPLCDDNLQVMTHSVDF